MEIDDMNILPCPRCGGKNINLCQTNHPQQAWRQCATCGLTSQTATLDLRFIEKADLFWNAEAMAVKARNPDTLSGDEAFAEAWRLFVTIKRDLDPIDNNPEGLCLSKETWRSCSDKMNEIREKLKQHHSTYLP